MLHGAVRLICIKLPNKTLTRTSPDALLANLTARQDSGIETQVQVGQGKVNFGTIGSHGESGALHRLFDVCNEISCEESVTVPTTLVGDTGPFDANIVIRILDASWHSFDERNNFINAIEASFEAMGDECEDVEWARCTPPGPGCHSETGSERLCSNANSIAIRTDDTSNNNAEIGNIRVKIDVENPNEGFCDAFGDILGLVEGALGSVASAFFGTVSAACQNI